MNSADCNHLEVEDPTDVPAVANAAVALLPASFRRAAYRAQLPARAGLVPEGRARLWFWLDRLLTGSELKAWMDGVPVDRSTLEDVAPIYPAAPILADGVAETVAGRWRSMDRWTTGDFLHDLDDDVAVPDDLAVAGTPRAKAPEALTRGATDLPRAEGHDPAHPPPRRRPAVRHRAAEVPRGGRLPSGREALPRCALNLYALAQHGLIDPGPATVTMKRIMIEVHDCDSDEVNRGRTLADINRQPDWAWDNAWAVENRP